MKKGDILIVRDDHNLKKLGGLLPGQRVILREVLSHVPDWGRIFRVELIGKPNKLDYSIHEWFFKTIQEVRDEKISQILGLPLEEIQK
jgi:hypothetical protein